MKHHRIRRDDEDDVGVVFIASCIPDQSRPIRRALLKAQRERRIGVVEFLEHGSKACQDRIECVMKRHRIDVIIAPHSAYRRIEAMRLAHLFVDLEALIFRGEGRPEIFSACPGKFGIAGTRQFDHGVFPSAAKWVQNASGLFGGPGGGKGRSGSIDVMLGMGGTTINYRDRLGAGQTPPHFHPGAKVASGGTLETMRFGGKEYQVDSSTNQYGGHDYYSGNTVVSTDREGNVREETNVYALSDRTVVNTTKYDEQGRVTEVHRTIDYIEDQTEDEETEPDDTNTGSTGAEPDETGRDVQYELKKFVESAMLQQLWEAQLSGIVPPEPTDVTREFCTWLGQQSMKDFCHSFQAQWKEKDETGYAMMYWLSQTLGAKEIHASKLWEYLWSKGAPVDPIGSLAYRSRLALLGGKMEDGEIELNFDKKHGKH